jgi:hypothetical protein
VTLVAAFAAAAHAGMRYGPIEISGAVDSQTLLRSAEIDEWQFVQNRNTALLRLDYDWLQDGRYIDRFDVPFLKRSKLYLLYRGVYDSFWGIAPGGRQKGVTEYDDRVGGPIIGPPIGTQVVNGHSCQSALDPNCVCPPGQVCTGRGIYTRTGSPSRDALAYENRMREAYIDLARADVPDDWGTAGKVLGWLLPTSARLGRQQVIWGESDYFRLMDVINPLDTTWHLGFEEWDKLRIPLWLIKGIWDMGDVGPISNAFTEIVWNPGDFQPGNKVEFLPAPWAVPIANPVRAGQIQVADPNSPSSMLTPLFNLEGTSFRKGDFHRDPPTRATSAFASTASPTSRWSTCRGSSSPPTTCTRAVAASAPSPARRSGSRSRRSRSIRLSSCCRTAAPAVRRRRTRRRRLPAAQSSRPTSRRSSSTPTRTSSAPRRTGSRAPTPTPSSASRWPTNWARPSRAPTSRIASTSRATSPA